MMIGGSAAIGLGLCAQRLPAQPRQFATPIRFGRTRLLVDAAIDGGPAMPVAIDSGAHISLIAAPLAHARGLRKVGSKALTVAGRFDRYDIVEARGIRLTGGIDLGRVAFAAIDPAIIGSDAGATLAAGALTLIDSELDFRAERLVFHPDGGPSRSAWVRHERAIVDAVDGGTAYLFADVAVGSAAVRLGLDTGAPTPLRLDPSIVASVMPGWRAVNWSPAFASGSTVTRVVRLPVTVAIGDLRLDRPIVTVREGAGVFRDGLVGLPLIRRMDLATEVRTKRLFTRANGLPAAPPSYNMSGLWVGRRGRALVAEAVGRGSPAELNGIRVGDNIDGGDFTQIIAGLNGPEGTIVRLTVNGRTISLALADYL